MMETKKQRERMRHADRPHEMWEEADRAQELVDDEASLYWTQRKGALAVGEIALREKLGTPEEPGKLGCHVEGPRTITIIWGIDDVVLNLCEEDGGVPATGKYIGDVGHDYLILDVFERGCVAIVEPHGNGIRLRGLGDTPQKAVDSLRKGARRDIGDVLLRTGALTASDVLESVARYVREAGG